MKQSRFVGFLFLTALVSIPPAAAQEFVTPPPRLDVNRSQGRLEAAIPLPALPGHGDFAPRLSLVYQAQARDGGQGFGVGWALSTSSIEVSSEFGLPHPYYSLNVDKKTRDTFFQLNLDGQSLRYVGQTNGVVEYSTESFDSRLQILRYDEPFTISVRDAAGQLQTQTISSGFEVRGADGMRRIYSGDSSVAESYFYSMNANLPEVQRKYTTRWPLVYEIRPGGDAIEYHYEVEAGRSYLSEVSFGSARSRYVLHRKARAAGPVSFAAGFRQDSLSYYTGLVACLDEQPQYTWLFGYAQQPAPDFQALSCEVATEQGLGAAEGRLNLQTIYRFGRSVGQPGDASIAREPTIELVYKAWEKPDAGAWAVEDFKTALITGFGLGRNAELFDANQDGRQDLVVFDKSTGTNKVYLHRDQGFVEGENFKIKRGNAAFTPLLNEGTQATRFLPADMNGDGWEDLIEIGSDTSWTFFMNRAAQGGTGYDATGTALSFKLDKTYLSDGRGSLIDINGDARPDIVFPILGTDGKAQFQAYLNTTVRGSRNLTFTARTFKFPFATTNTAVLTQPEFRFVDANHDGLVDLVKIVALNTGAKGLCVFENQGQAGLPNAALFREDKPKPGVTCEDQYFLPIIDLNVENSLAETFNSMVLIDVNGDGVMDFTRINDRTEAFEYWLGRVGGKGFETRQALALAGDIKISRNKYDTLTADLDQDGYDEILLWNADTKSVQVIRLNQEPGLGQLAALRLENGWQQQVSYANYVKAFPQPLTLVKRITSLADDGDADDYTYGSASWDAERAQFLGFDQTLTYSPGTNRGDIHLEPARVLLENFASGLETLEQRRYLWSLPKITEVYDAPWNEHLEKEFQAGRLTFPSPAAQTLLQRSTRSWSLKAFSPPLASGEPTAHLRPRYFIKWDNSEDMQCGTDSSACDKARSKTVSYQYDETAFRWIKRVQSASSIKGPRELNLQPAAVETSLVYDKDSERLGIWTNIQERQVKSLLSGQIFSSYTAAYHPVWGLATQESWRFPVIERDRVPERLRVHVPTETKRTSMRAYDGGDGTGFGILESIADEEGLIESYSYGPGSIFRIATQNAKGHITHTCYSTRDCSSSEAGILNGSLRPVFTRNPQGYQQRTTLDALHRPLQVQGSEGEELNFAYVPGSSERPLVIERQLKGFEPSLAFYDAEGQLMAVAQGQGRDPAFVRSQEQRSRSGKIVTQAVPYAASNTITQLRGAPWNELPKASAFATSAFDSLGRLVQAVNAGKNQIVTYAYPSWGQTEITEADGISRTRQVVARDLQQPEALIDEEDHVHVYRRNEFGLLREIQSPDDVSPRLFVYDGRGLLLASVIPGIQSRVLERDTRGRVRFEHTLSFDGKTSQTIGHSFDEMDRLTQVTQGSIVLKEYYYDRLQNPLSGVLESPGALVGMLNRDPEGQLDTWDLLQRDSKDRIIKSWTSYQRADGQPVRTFRESRTYAADDQISDVCFDAELCLFFHYNPAGALQSLDSVDAGGRSTRILNDAQWSPADMLEKTEFADGKWAGVWVNDPVQLWNDTRTISGEQESKQYTARGFLRQRNERSFTYNKRGELIAAADPTLEESWQWSGAGHFLSANPGRSPLLPRSRNEAPLRFDGFGRIIQYRNTSADFDGLDRVLESRTGERISRYGYHADDLRSYKKTTESNGQHSLTFYPSESRIFRQILQGEAPVSESAQIHVKLPGGLLAAFDGTSQAWSFLTVDQVGTPLARINPQGEVVERWTRGVYGTSLRPQTDSLTPGFAGHQEDEESGWVAVGQRSFIPELARFITPDPLFRDDPERCLLDNWQECELYTYALNNPVAFEDPTGLASKSSRSQPDRPRRPTKSNPSTSRHASRPVSHPGAAGAAHDPESGSHGEANDKNHSEAEAELAISNPERNPAQDRLLSNKDAKRVGAHLVKDGVFGGTSISKFNLYRDRQGNIYMKRTGSGGFGEPTGYNMREIK